MVLLKKLEWVLLFMSLLPVAEASTGADVVGEAHDLESGNLLYREHYFCSSDWLRCSVLYRDTGGELIARKELDYTGNPLSPSLVMVDYRLTREVRLGGSGDPELVTDAGFDNLVRKRWEELEQGLRIRFPFLVTGRERPLAVKVQQVEGGQCNAEQLCLQVRLDSWLLSRFVDPIKLTYDRASRRLLRYRGVSNLLDAAGDTQRVDIRFSYFVH
jgi:hypothetical protein